MKWLGVAVLVLCGSVSLVKAAPPTYNAVPLQGQFILERKSGSNSKGEAVVTVGNRAYVRNTITGEDQLLPSPDSPNPFFVRGIDISESGLITGEMVETILIPGKPTRMRSTPIFWDETRVVAQKLGIPCNSESVIGSNPLFIRSTGAILGWVDVQEPYQSGPYSSIPVWWDPSGLCYDMREFVHVPDSGTIHRVFGSNPEGDLLASEFFTNQAGYRDQRFWKLTPEASTAIPESSSLLYLLSAIPLLPLIRKRS